MKAAVFTLAAPATVPEKWVRSRSYKDARPLRKAMKDAVITKNMPLWPEDAKYGHFSNDRSIYRAIYPTGETQASGGATKGLKT